MTDAMDPYAFEPYDDDGRHVGTKKTKKKRTKTAPQLTITTDLTGTFRRSTASAPTPPRPASAYLREKRAHDDLVKALCEDEVRREVASRRFQIAETLVEINAMCREEGNGTRYSVAQEDMDNLGQRLGGYFIRKSVVGVAKDRMLNVHVFFSDYERMKVVCVYMFLPRLCKCRPHPSVVSMPGHVFAPAQPAAVVAFGPGRSRHRCDNASVDRHGPPPRRVQWRRQRAHRQHHGPLFLIRHRLGDGRGCIVFLPQCPPVDRSAARAPRAPRRRPVGGTECIGAGRPRAGDEA